MERFIVISLDGHLVYSFDSTDILRQTFPDLFRTTWLSLMSGSGSSSSRSSSTSLFTLRIARCEERKRFPEFGILIVSIEVEKGILFEVEDEVLLSDELLDVWVGKKAAVGNTQRLWVTLHQVRGGR
jgi:hypothetical protein